MLKTPPNQPVRFTLASSREFSSLQEKFGLRDIMETFIISTDIDTEMTALKNLSPILRELGDDVKLKIAYSPVHYNVSKNLSDVVEHSDDGDVASIGGFSNPFEMIAISVVDKNDDLVADASILMKEFAFVQTMDEIISDTIKLS